MSEGFLVPSRPAPWPDHDEGQNESGHCDEFQAYDLWPAHERRRDQNGGSDETQDRYTPSGAVQKVRGSFHCERGKYMRVAEGYSGFESVGEARKRETAARSRCCGPPSNSFRRQCQPRILLLPTPVTKSQPGPAVKVPAFPLVTSWKKVEALLVKPSYMACSTP